MTRGAELGAAKHDILEVSRHLVSNAVDHLGADGVALRDCGPELRPVAHERMDALDVGPVERRQA